MKHFILLIAVSIISILARAQAKNDSPLTSAVDAPMSASSQTTELAAGQMTGARQNPLFGIQQAHSSAEAAPPLSIAFVEHERPKHVVDRKFAVLTLFAVAATVGDVESTEYGTAHGASEGNPLVAAHPSRPVLYGISLPVSAGMAWWSYKLKRTAPHSAHWMIPLCVTAGIHSGAAVNNLVRADP